MSIDALLNAVRTSSLGSMIRGETGSAWWFPNIETIHVLAITVVVGSILMVDLRLVGLTSRDSAVSRLSREVLPYTWAAFAVAVMSGTLLFVSKPDIYFYNLQFRLKFLFMALAGMNMLIFHHGVYRRVLDWDRRLPPPPMARAAGLLSIALWIAVVFMGRWIGFKT